jgi:hypothetical protein
VTPLTPCRSLPYRSPPCPLSFTSCPSPPVGSFLTARCALAPSYPVPVSPPLIPLTQTPTHSPCPCPVVGRGRLYVYQEAYLSQFRIVISGFLTFVSLSPFPPLSLSVGLSPKPKSEHPPVPYLRTVLRLIPLHGPPPASSIPEFPVFSSFSASSLKRLDLRGFHPLRFLPPKDSPLTVFVIFHFRPVSRF